MGCQTTSAIECNVLPEPPQQVTDTLRNADDGTVDAWAIELARFYMRQERCLRG